MVYLIAILMGYVIATNGLVEKRINSGLAGLGYANRTFGKLSSIGGLAGWFCVLPAAFFVGSAYGNGFLEGVFFCLAVFAGAALGGFLQIASLAYAISAFAIFINVALAAIVYAITR